jgi:hypothetical protein
MPDVTSTSMEGPLINDATPLDAIGRISTARQTTDTAKSQHCKKSGIGQRRSTLRGAKERLVANAGRWQSWGPHQPLLPTTSGNTADVIVLNAPIEQRDRPAVLQPSLESVAPPETSCRGPPAPRRRPLDPAGDHSCVTAMKNGKTACAGRSIRMDKLDTLVTQHLADRLLDPQRLSEMLSTLAARRAHKQASVDKRIAALAREAENAEERLRLLYKLVEVGHAEMDDLLKDRILSLKADREAALAALGRASSAIEVDDHTVRIMGRKEVLEQAVMANECTQPVAHSFVPNWRPRQDLNLRPSV